MKKIKCVLIRMINLDSWDNGLISVKFFSSLIVNFQDPLSSVPSVPSSMYGQVLEYLVVYAVSFHSKGCIFSLGLCYNLIPVLVQRQLGKSSLEENKHLLIRHLTQVRPCCCWQLRRGWFHLTKEREPLGRLPIKKILSVPLCRFTYPNVPILVSHTFSLRILILSQRPIEVVQLVFFAALLLLLVYPVNDFQQ